MNTTQNQNLTLTISKLHPVRRNEQYRFDGAGLRIIKIGRLRSAHVTIEDRHASRLQAVIKLQHGMACFQNLGKQQRVELNGNPLPSADDNLLADGDVVRLGETELLIGLREGDEPVAEPTLIRMLRQAGTETRSRVEAALRIRNTVHAPPTPGEPEKYDTRFLLARIRRERWAAMRRTVLLALLGLVSLYALAG